MARANTAVKKDGNGTNLGFEQTLWQTADKLRNNMDAAEYKHVILGVIFLKYISDAFEARHKELVADQANGADPEHPGRVPTGKRVLGTEGSSVGSCWQMRSSRRSAKLLTTR